MAQNITLMGASYSAVPAVTLPKTGGGTARFDDTSDANAVASDIASGKTAYVNGAKVTGTNSGGSYEDGDEMGYGSAGLAGTTWYFNDTLDFSSGIEINPGRLNFTSNNTNFTIISIRLPYFVFYGDDFSYFIGWENAAYRTITITGGDDANNPDLIAWIQANAVQQ